MKRTFAMILACAMILCVMPISVQGAQTHTTVEFFEDGSYNVTTIEESAGRMMTKVGSKKTSHYSSNHELEWVITVTGEFLYDGTTSTCTYASGVVTIVYTAGWYFISDHSSWSGNTANYYVTFGQKALGVTIDRPTCSVSLSCDENGNLS